MDIFSCPKCNTRFQVDTSQAPLRFNCTNCNQELSVKAPKQILTAKATPIIGTQTPTPPAPAPAVAPPTPAVVPPAPALSPYQTNLNRPRKTTGLRYRLDPKFRILLVFLGSLVSLILFPVLYLFILTDPILNAKTIHPASLDGTWYGRDIYAINLPDQFIFEGVDEKTTEFTMRWTLPPQPGNDKAENPDELRFTVVYSESFFRFERPNIHTKPGSYVISGPGHFYVIEGGTIESLRVDEAIFFKLNYPRSKSGEAQFTAIARLAGAEIIIEGRSSAGEASQNFQMLNDVLATFQIKHDGINEPKLEMKKQPK